MKALTGIVLADGEAVFWKGGEWVSRFRDADLFDDDAKAEAAEGLGGDGEGRPVVPRLE